MILLHCPCPGRRVAVHPWHRRHHTPGHEPPGVHAAAGGAGARAQTAPHTIRWHADSEEVAILIAADRRRLLQSPKAGTASYRLFEMLPMMPRFTIERVRQQLDTCFPTATAAVKALEVLGIVTEMPGQKTNRSYSYHAYVELLSR